MASLASRSPTTMVMGLAVLAGIATVASSTKWEPKETHLVFYMQDWVTGKNITAVSVAGVDGTKSSVVVTDDALTETPERDSKEIGRAQGIYVNCALGGSDTHFLFSAVFTEGKYSGSTLEFQGTDRFLLKQREISVVSGTGYFRFARGFAVLDNAYLDLPNVNAVLTFNVTVLHY